MAAIDVGDDAPLRPHQMEVSVKVNPPGPGPGSYPQRSVIGEGYARATSFGGSKNARFTYKSDPKAPGPGSYAQGSTFVPSFNSRLSSPCTAKFGSAPRDESHKLAKMPGPGAYGAPQPPHATPSFSFGGRMANAPRSKESKLTKSPGPGQYAVPSSFGQGSGAPVAGFGTSARFPARRKKSNAKGGKLPPVASAGPGPGTTMGPQQLSTAWSEPVFRFGTAKRQPLGISDPKLAGGPGPGEHVPRAAFGIQKESRLRSQPVFKFGTSKRETIAF